MPRQVWTLDVDPIHVVDNVDVDVDDSVYSNVNYDDFEVDVDVDFDNGMFTSLNSRCWSIHVVDVDVDVDVYINVDNDNFEIDVDFDNDRFTSFKQYINHLLSKACAAAKKEVFLIRFDVNSFMELSLIG